jgi:HEPN domain-containing protein
MTNPEHVVLIAWEWINKAENDLKNASHTLKLGKECPTDTVCFHAQQCIEKYLKAFLVVLEIGFSKTHDIETLLWLIPKNIRIPLSVTEQRQLTAYAALTRYPGLYEPISLAEAKRAVKLAQRVKTKMQKLLETKGLF